MTQRVDGIVARVNAPSETRRDPASPWRSGLSDVEAQARLQREGFNELPHPKRRTPLRIVAEVLREPMLALLLGGGLVYLALGDVREALVLLVFATLSIAITVIQESRTERVLDALRDLSSPRALVVRDGERRRIPGREIVRGDLVVLSEGDRVPADAWLVEGESIQVDESLLTGESLAVRKRSSADPRPVDSPRPGGDDLTCVFSGSLIVGGTGLGEVIATGAASEIGKIGRTLGELEPEPSRLKLQTQRLVAIFAAVAFVVVAVVVLLYGALRGGWIEATLAGIALGMSMLPEEFPVVLTVFLAMGAWRISRARVLTRRMAAIESLGAATVLCTDKTGTLTENRMRVVELRLPDGRSFRRQDAPAEFVPAAFEPLARFARLASAPEPVDPVDRAIHELERSMRATAATERPRDERPVHSYPLRPELLVMSQVWRSSVGAQSFLVAAKGAPEAVATLCRLDAAATATLTRAIDAMASEGRRVLAVARAAHSGPAWPSSQRDFAFELVGLVGLADPLRAGVTAAVAECRSAGIRVAMITGDYPATARAIAGQAAIPVTDVITGEELARLDESELARRAGAATIFARVMPEQKLRIVDALKANGEIVAMTGDGVNDAPALKAAHIGVAMGGRGTDVAREASAIVLLDDDFGSIVKAVRLGRRIHDNLRKTMGFVLAVHVPIAGLALLPLLTGLPLLFGPIHIAFLEMVIDPVCSLAFEAEDEEGDIMQRPPRPVDERLVSGPLVIWSLLQGAFALLLVGAIYLLGAWREMPAMELRALTFFSLVLTIVGLIFVNRSFSASLADAIRRPNHSLGFVLVTVALVLALTLLWPRASELFHFGPLHLDDLAMTAAAGALVLVILDRFKPLCARGAAKASGPAV